MEEETQPNPGSSGGCCSEACSGSGVDGTSGSDCLTRLLHTYSLDSSTSTPRSSRRGLHGFLDPGVAGGKEEGGSGRLLEALKHQQSWLVKWMLQHDEEAVLRPLLDERDAEGRGPLHYAAKAGDMETVKALVERGADVRARDFHGHDAAEEAQYRGHTQVSEYLRDASVTVEGLVGLVEGGDHRAVKALLLQGQRHSDKVERACLLHRAARTGDETMLRLLLAAGLDCDKLDEAGHTAAEVALMQGRLEAYQILSAHKIAASMEGGAAGEEEGAAAAQPPDQPPSLWSAFGTSYGSSSALMDEVMLRQPLFATSASTLKAAQQPIRTPLHVAASCGSVSAIRELCGPWPVDCLDADLNTPLHLAIVNRHADAAALLIDLQADVNKRNRWGSTPLSEAVRTGQEALCLLLRDHDACLYLDLDSQQVMLAPRDSYLRRLELAASLLAFGCGRNPVVRFFPCTHHSPVLLACPVRPKRAAAACSPCAPQSSPWRGGGGGAAVGEGPPTVRKGSSTLQSIPEDGDGRGRGETVDPDMTPQVAEEVEAVLSHLLLDSRSWFVRQALESGQPLVIDDAIDRGPDDMCLSTLLSFTGHRHVVVVPLQEEAAAADEGRQLGVFICLYRSPVVPVLPQGIVEELQLLVSGQDVALTRWLSLPGVDASRLLLFLRSRHFRHLSHKWTRAVWSQESYNFMQPNMLLLSVLESVRLKQQQQQGGGGAGALDLVSVCEACPWVREAVDAVFLQREVLLPTSPSRELWGLNADRATELRALGLHPPDYSSPTARSPIFAHWLRSVARYVDTAEPLEADVAELLRRDEQQRQQDEEAEAAQGGSSSLVAAMAGLTGLPSPEWVFTNRDVWDLIGQHEYDAGLAGELSTLADPTQAFPCHDLAFAVDLANKLSKSGPLRGSAVLGVVTGHLYRTFLPHSELAKAWDHLWRTADDLQRRGRPATAAFVVYKSVLEYLHPFQDGNGRFARCVVSVLLRRAGYRRLLMSSDLKVLSCADFFKLLGREREQVAKARDRQRMYADARRRAAAAAAAKPEAAGVEQ